MRNQFKKGILHGLPIGIGYLSVSFGFGIQAVKCGFSVLEASMVSLSCLTSAGQTAGVNMVAAGGTLIEISIVQFVINLRYALMALSLSQKLDKKFTFFHRLIASYGITDEIFGVSIAQPVPLTPAYMYGLIFVSCIGWVTGTFLGAMIGQILPASITAALGILLYGMFIAIIVPPSKKDYKIFIVVIIAAFLSVLCKYCLKSLSAGMAIILSAVVASAIAALIFPEGEEES